jgi:urease accessory protein
MKAFRLLTPFLLLATPAMAHTGHDTTGFASGFMHPFGGLDHLLAMLTVGLWAAMRGRSAMLAWPAAFLTAMLAGFALARLGFVLPTVEMMIAASVVLLGLAVATGLQAPIALGAVLLAVFGAAHGFAHGAEATGGVAGFTGGFLIATAALHAAGLGLGRLALPPRNPWIARIGGAAIALAGVTLGLA